MKYLTTITGRVLGISSNKSTRTFRIKTGDTIYQTTPMSKSEFNSNLNNTANDWSQFLKECNYDYYKVK